MAKSALDMKKLASIFFNPGCGSDNLGLPVIRFACFATNTGRIGFR